ncbi:hypothetical protein [Pseudomonas sp. S3_A09]
MGHLVAIARAGLEDHFGVAGLPGPAAPPHHLRFGDGQPFQLVDPHPRDVGRADAGGLDH